VSMAMSLTGTFEAPDFAEVLTLVARRSCTGRLSIRAGSMHATIRLNDGFAVGVEVSGGIWRESGRDWRASLEEAFLQVLRAGRGSFEFQPGDRFEVASVKPVKLPAVVAAATKRLAKWREVDSVIPSMSAIPQLAEGMVSATMSVDREQWRVIVAIDGRRTVAGVARRLNMDQLSLAQILKPLVEDGAVTLVGPESWSKSTLTKSLDVAGGADGADGAESTDVVAEVSDDAVAGADQAATGEGPEADGPRRSTIVIPAYRTRPRPTGLPAGAAPLA
jgi:hypothetical protein